MATCLSNPIRLKFKARYPAAGLSNHWPWVASVVTIGGIGYVIAGANTDFENADIARDDGRRRLPPGQRSLVEEPAHVVDTPAEPAKPKLIRQDYTTKDKPRIPPNQKQRPTLKDMAPAPSLPDAKSRADVKIKIYGQVEREQTFNFDQLLGLTKVEQRCDVHCVTGWSMLGGLWTGVRLLDIAELVKPTKCARHVIFECHAGYTANIDIAEALKPSSLLAWDLNRSGLSNVNGAPVRSLIPDRYFWKSSKWLTGIKFVERDEPGYWEVRGYHNHADPWLEERHA